MKLFIYLFIYFIYLFYTSLKVELKQLYSLSMLSITMNLTKPRFAKEMWLDYKAMVRKFIVSQAKLIL